MAGRSGSHDTASLLKRKAAETNAILHVTLLSSSHLCGEPLSEKEATRFLCTEARPSIILIILFGRLVLHQGKVPRQVGFIDRASN